MRQQIEAFLNWFQDNIKLVHFHGEWVKPTEVPEYKALLELINGPKTFQDLMNLIPDSEVLEDNDGQLVIYTNKTLDKDDLLVDFDPQ